MDNWAETDPSMDAGTRQPLLKSGLLQVGIAPQRRQQREPHRYFRQILPEASRLLALLNKSKINPRSVIQQPTRDALPSFLLSTAEQGPIPLGQPSHPDFVLSQVKVASGFCFSVCRFPDSLSWEFGGNGVPSSQGTNWWIHQKHSPSNPVD